MRYAIDGSIKITKTERFDAVIVGAGLAGLYAALNIDERLSCCILAKEKIDVSNTYLAQGGIAAAVAEDDAPVLHVEDTLTAGAGLCDRAAVEVLCDEGPGDVTNLFKMHVPFDFDEEGELSITREGGHHKNRVLHAGGDATGRETVKALARIVANRRNITLREDTCFYDIVLAEGGAVAGCVVSNGGTFTLIETPNIIIATGGVGQIYRNSTNPSVATGDGIAAAMRAGAAVKDMEFIQFHPTGLWTPESAGQTFLISEAVRGEGGLLVNRDGVRFMAGVHPLAELAPRDIVARGIFSETERTGAPCAYIDITHKSAEFLPRRFPTIYGECLKRGIDITKDRIPVRPVQHYIMGGIKTDLNARTNIDGLYACGEAACSGVHGANRLASNSMLECLVFGRRAAEDINARGREALGAVMPSLAARPIAAPDIFSAARREIQDVMSACGHVVRTPRGLENAIGEVRRVRAELESVFSPESAYLETLNVAAVAEAVLSAAISRTGSVGAHYIVADSSGQRL